MNRILKIPDRLCKGCFKIVAKYRISTGLVCCSLDCLSNNDSVVIPFDLDNKGYDNRGEWYRNYDLKSKYWKLLKEKGLSYYNYICKSCKGKAETLHHKHYNTIGNEDISKDLEPYCNFCHSCIVHGTIYSKVPDIDSIFYNKIDRSCFDSKFVEFMSVSSNSKKNKIRNDLFHIVSDYILFHINSWYIKLGYSISKQKQLSISWDCFENLLKYYKVKYNLRRLIKNHVFYIISSLYRREIKYKDFEDCFLEEEIDVSCCSESLDVIIDLIRFRDSLPKEHRIVWDDAILSQSSAPKERYISYNHDLTQSTYFNLKKSFISMVGLYRLI